MFLLSLVMDVLFAAKSKSGCLMLFAEMMGIYKETGGQARDSKSNILRKSKLGKIDKNTQIRTHHDPHCS